MTVTIQQAQTDLLGLLRRLPPGETLTLTDNETPVATVTPTPPTPTLRPPPGLWKGKVVILSEEDDFPNGFGEGTP